MNTFSELFTRKRIILTSRPKGMSFEKYKAALRNQKEWLRNRRKGFLVYKAVEIYEQTFENAKGEKTKQQLRRTFAPFVGDVSTLKPI
jgi:hypothetical protein